MNKPEIYMDRDIDKYAERSLALVSLSTGALIVVFSVALALL
jgi:hypothetical protein